MIIAVAVPVAASSNPTQPSFSAGLLPLLTCRTLADAPARLACFDRESEELDAQTARRDLVVMNRDQIERVQKEQFGRSSAAYPTQATSNGNSSKIADFIEDKLESARLSAEGKWMFTLTNGAVWRQTELSDIRSPTVGVAIRILKGALGSFLASINGRPAIRVKRIR